MELTGEGLDTAKVLRSALDQEDGDRDGAISNREFNRAVMEIDRSLSSRDATKLFEYLDEKGSDDGSLRVRDAVETIVKKGRSSSRDHLGSSRSPRSHRSSSRESRGASRVFRKQPYLLKEVVRQVKKLEATGRPLDNLLRDFKSTDRNGDSYLNRVDFAE